MGPVERPRKHLEPLVTAAKQKSGVQIPDRPGVPSTLGVIPRTNEKKPRGITANQQEGYRKNAPGTYRGPRAFKRQFSVDDHRQCRTPRKYQPKRGRSNVSCNRSPEKERARQNATTQSESNACAQTSPEHQLVFFCNKASPPPKSLITTKPFVRILAKEGSE